MFALVDCNNFYASCERLFRPDLRGKAVVVLSNNDGCVIARSNEAKALGIKMGVPEFQIRELINSGKVAVFSSNYELYGDVSNRVMQTLSYFSPNIENYSIDESFLELTGIKELSDYSIEIRRKVLQNVGIPTCVGVGPSKTLAKAANNYAKKMTDTGVFVIDSEDKRKTVLDWMGVGDVWGIGRRYQKWMLSQNINTAWDLANMNIERVREKMGIVGVRLVNELKGISCIPLEELAPPKQNICTSRSFGQLIQNKEEIWQSIVSHTSRCSEKLRSQNSVTGAIQVFVHTNVFRTHDQQYYGTITIPINRATNSTFELLEYAKIGLNTIFREGYNYKKSGVIVLDIVPESQVQASLFDIKLNREEENKTMKAVDEINKIMGRDTVRFASSHQKQKWKLRQDRLSPRYTTRLNEILKVHI